MFKRFLKYWNDLGEQAKAEKARKAEEALRKLQDANSVEAKEKRAKVKARVNELELKIVEHEAFLLHQQEQYAYKRDMSNERSIKVKIAIWKKELEQSQKELSELP